MTDPPPYELQDPEPVEDSGGTLVSFGQTSEGLAAAAAAAASFARGPVRATGADEAWNMQRLLDAATGKVVLPNPGGSPGCSPILREILLQSGLPHIVDVELAKDGDLLGHQGGNALDVRGLDDDGTQAIVDLLIRIAGLFRVAGYTSPSGVPTMVFEGVAGTYTTFAGADIAGFVARCTKHIHIASTRTFIQASIEGAVGTLGGTHTVDEYVKPPADGEIPASNGIVGDRVYTIPIGKGDVQMDDRPGVL